MALTFDDVRRVLAPDEPDYRRAAELGSEALPHLLEMIESGDPHLAPKATYAAGLVGGTDAVTAASRKENPAVRVAAASATQYLTPEQSRPILQELLNDENYGVRKMALRYVPKGASGELLSHVKRVEESTNDAILRRLAREALERNA